MTVRHAGPTFFHAVLGEKQLGVVSADAPLQPRLRRCGMYSAACHIDYVRK
jgi:hypothetical protein